MNKIFKSRIFSFVLGAIIFGGIGVTSAYTLFANNIGFTPRDTTWEVDNTKKALDDLYDKQTRIVSLWKNDNPNANFDAQTINLNLSNYDYIIIRSKRTITDGETIYFNPRYNIIKVGTSGSYILGIDQNSGYNWIRDISVSESGVTFSTAIGRCYGVNNQDNKIDVAIPLEIYGIKFGV